MSDGAIEIGFGAVGWLGVAAILMTAPRVSRQQRTRVYALGGGWLLAFAIIGPLIANGELFFGVIGLAGEVFTLALTITGLENLLKQRDVDRGDEPGRVAKAPKEPTGW